MPVWYYAVIYMGKKTGYYKRKTKRSKALFLGGFLELHSSENFEPDSTEPQVSSFEPDVVEIYENLENTE